MTRAAERLIVCGTKGVNKSPDGCWHQLVLDALKPESVESEDADVGTIWRFSKSRGAAMQELGDKTASPIELPAWLRASVTTKPPALRMLTPSDTSATDEPHRFATGADRASALLRGSLTHRLLQSLPDIAADRRGKAMQAYLARAGRKLPVEEREKISEQVLQVLEHPRFSALYASGSRAEAPIVGRIKLGGETVAVAGQVDRLVVTQDAVLIADFKTNRPAPRRIADVPLAYVRQLALYRAVLEKLYPQRTVRAALIWTEVPDLMELSGDALTAALKQITPA
jgi:ATP-dependent helicase/nuclease subunit A